MNEKNKETCNDIDKPLDIKCNRKHTELPVSPFCDMVSDYELYIGLTSVSFPL
jgi:hypothetical protein